MKKYMKAGVSLLIGAVCILIGMITETKNEFIIYFLYMIGIVNIYIGIKDLLNVYQNTKK